MKLTPEQLARFHEDGFPVLPGLFSEGEVEALRRPLAQLFSEDVPQNFPRDGVRRDADRHGPPPA